MLPSTKPVYIFDLDGTLSDTSARIHHLQKKPKDWDAFYSQCSYDKPIQETVRIAQVLCHFSDVWIWTGRSADVYKQTAEWLSNYVPAFDISNLLMRPSKDFRTDEDLKSQWWSGLGDYNKNRVVGVFEDRAHMVQMWRRLGLTCYQVAEGNF